MCAAPLQWFPAVCAFFLLISNKMISGITQTETDTVLCMSCVFPSEWSLVFN